MTQYIESKVITVGNSAGIVIPQSMRNYWDIDEGDFVTLEVRDVNRRERERYKKDKERRRR